jgi:hypothetical protein
MVRQRRQRDKEKEKSEAQTAQAYLENVPGTPFYHTPTTPADPRDCSRYPDSPWCGGFPFTNRFIGLSVSQVQDDCNLGVQFDGDFGFIKAAPFQIVYRNPQCQFKIQPPAKLPINNNATRQITPPCDWRFFIDYFPYQKYFEDGIKYGNFPPVGYYFREIFLTLTNLKQESGIIPLKSYAGQGYGMIPPLISGNFNYSWKGEINFNATHKANTAGILGLDFRKGLWNRSGGEYGDIENPRSEWTIEKTGKINFWVRILSNFSAQIFYQFGDEIVNGSWLDSQNFEAVGIPLNLVARGSRSTLLESEISQIRRDKNQILIEAASVQEWLGEVPSLYEPREVSIKGEFQNAFGTFYDLGELINIRHDSKNRKQMALCLPVAPPPPVPNQTPHD